MVRKVVLKTTNFVCVSFALVVIAPEAAAVNIYVRAVNARDGRPIGGKTIWLKMCDESLVNCRPGYLGACAYTVVSARPHRFWLGRRQGPTPCG
jgi:hypothetical protein